MLYTFGIDLHSDTQGKKNPPKKLSLLYIFFIEVVYAADEDD